MAAPQGNQNAVKNRPWTDALRRELAQYQGDGIKAGEALRAIARQVVAGAIKGEKDSIKEIGERLDGKPHQSVDVDATVAGQIIVQMASKDADI
jgi:hypothetical protein